MIIGKVTFLSRLNGVHALRRLRTSRFSGQHLRLAQALPLADALANVCVGERIIGYDSFAPVRSSKQQAFAQLGVAAELGRSQAPQKRARMLRKKRLIGYFEIEDGEMLEPTGKRKGNGW
jgi:hypothetical protein